MTEEHGESTPHAAPPQQSAEAQSIVGACEQASRLLSIYKATCEDAARGHFLDAAQRLNGHEGIASKLKAALAKVMACLDTSSLEEEVRTAARSARLAYRDSLERALTTAGLTFEAQWPSYAIDDVLQLRVDIAKGNATIDGKKLGTVELGPIVELLKEKVEELLSRQFAAPEFLHVLSEAYEQVVTKQGRGFGEYVDVKLLSTIVRDVMRISAQDEKYNDAKFAVDLYRLTLSGRPILENGAYLEFSPAQNSAGGLFIPGRHAGNYVAAVRFTRESVP